LRTDDALAAHHHVGDGHADRGLPPALLVGDSIDRAVGGDLDLNVSWSDFVLAPSGLSSAFAASSRFVTAARSYVTLRASCSRSSSVCANALLAGDALIDDRRRAVE
jgi:hypothetical protein